MVASRCSNFIHFKSGYLCISSEFHFTRFQWGNQWSKTLTVTLQNFLRSMVADFTDVVQTSPTTGVLSRRAEGVRVDQHWETRLCISPHFHGQNLLHSMVPEFTARGDCPDFSHHGRAVQTSSGSPGCVFHPTSMGKSVG